MSSHVIDCNLDLLKLSRENNVEKKCSIKTTSSSNQTIVSTLLLITASTAPWQVRKSWFSFFSTLGKVDLVNEGLAVVLLEVGEQPHCLHCSCGRVQVGDASIAAVTV